MGIFEKANVDYELEEPLRPAKGEAGRHKWIGYLWDSANNSAEERKLLFKVDAAILTIFCLGYLGKALVQSDANNAFLSGMKEDLGMYGNELVHSQTLFNVGYILGQLPYTLLLTRFPTHWCIPALEILVAAMTIANYSVKDVKSLYALRFLAGFFEGGYFPGVMYILSSWYTPVELGKRSGLFYASGSLGGMFSGVFQSAAHTNLNGVGGLAGWRWLFIIDGIYLFGVALLGLVFIPDIPSMAKPNFLMSQSDIDLAKARLERIERAPPTPWTKAKFRRIVSSWQLWLFPICYAMYNSGTPQQGMGYWLKSFNASKGHPAPVPGKSYSISQINLLPLPYLAVAAVTGFVFNLLSDGPLGGRRWPVALFCNVGNFAVALGLLFIPLYNDIPGRFALYYLNYINTGAAMAIYSWQAESTAFDSELRAIVSAVSNMAAFIINAIAPNFVWKTVDFPRAHKGYIFSISLSAVQFVVIPLILFLEARQKKIDARAKDAEDNSPQNPSSSSEKGDIEDLEPAVISSLGRAPDTIRV